MGGVVSVTFRKPDGKEYRMQRWTNSMPWSICNMGLVEKDEKHIDAYLKQWLEMKEDYERNKDTGKFQYNMTDAYFPSAGLCPVGYGLVVVDCINNVILTSQDYTSFDKIHTSSIYLEQNNGVIGMTPEDEYSDTNRLRRFFESGRIKRALKYVDDKMQEVDISEYSFDELIKKISTVKPFDCFIDYFEVDLSPFTIEKYEEYDPEEWKDMYWRVKSLGFLLSKEEECCWKEAIEELIEEEE